MYTDVKLYHITAHDAARGIGIGNTLPWHISADLKRFKELTRHGVVIMGRTTFLSLASKPLSNRLNIVITSDIKSVEHQPGVVRFNDIKKAITYAKLYASFRNLDKVWIIGGETIYRQTMDLIDGIELTYILQEVEGVDAFYPAITEDFKLINSQPVVYDNVSGLDYAFLTYQKEN